MRRPLVMLAAAALVVAGCGDDDDDADGSVTAACDALADLATSILDAPDTADPEAFVASIEPAVETWAVAASDDDELGDLVEGYRSSLERYAELGGIDAREAGNEADIALDRAAARCIELGARADFPEEPD